MSCNSNSERAVTASRKNGVMGQVGRYLNALGSWSTYRDIGSVEDIPVRVGQVTAAYLGLKGVSGQGLPQLAGILGAVVAVQALEQATGAGVTFGARLLGRGEPIGKYRGVIVRKSPITPRWAKTANRLSGGRVEQAEGYYFFESGRTWHSQTVTVQFGDTPRTLTQARSFSLPYREYYFDRAISPQTVVDLVKGDRDPDTVPGFIGSVNELENITPLGGLKRAFFAANWLLIDEGERDEGSPGAVDYDTLVGRRPSSGSYAQTGPPPGSSGPYRSDWPSTSRRVPVGGGSPPPQAVPVRSSEPPQPYGSQYFRSSTAPSSGDPYERIADRYRTADGKLYPLLIRGLRTNPLTMARKADAIYYDGELKRWREVVEDEAQLSLAREVEAGRLRVTPDWQSKL